MTASAQRYRAGAAGVLRWHGIQQTAAPLRLADPQFHRAHREPGEVYIRPRHDPEAIEELEAALRDDPEDGGAMYFPGGLYVQAGENEKGLPNFERAHQMTPASWAALYMGK